MTFVPDFISTIAYWKYCFPAFIFGSLCRDYKLITYIDDYVYKVLSFSFIAYLFLYSVYEKDCYVYTTQCYIFKGSPFMQLYIDVYRCLIGIIGSIFVLSAIRLWYNHSKNGMLWLSVSLLGKQTMGIYIFSSLIVELTTKYNNYVLIPGPFMAFTSTVATIILSLILTKIVQLNRFTNLLVLGGR